MTMTNYMNLIDEKSNNADTISNFWDVCQAAGTVVPQSVIDAEARNEEIKAEIETIPMINVSYYIGHRRYFDSVIKLGKTYFDRNTKMTARAGYRSINEIEEITEDMDRQMMADSHWY